MKRSICLIFLFVILSPVTILAQDTCRWAWSGGGSSVDAFSYIKHDNWGNIYAFGTWSSQNISIAGSNYTSLGAEEDLLVKFDSLGNILWSAAILGNNTSDARGLQVDKWGNIYVCGSFSDYVTIAGHTLVDHNPLNGDYDIYVAKFDSSGSLIWAKNYGASQQSGVYAMRLAQNEKSVYLTGYFSSTWTYNGLSISPISSSFDVLIAQIDSSGNVINLKSFGGKGQDIGLDLDLDSRGYIYLAGTHTDSINVSGFNSLPDYASFVLVLDSSLNIKHAKNICDPTTLSLNGGILKPVHLIVDNDSNIYISTYYFDSATVNSITYHSSGSYDGLILKINTAGQLLWAKQLNGPSADIPHGLCLDKHNQLFLTGYFSGSWIIDSVSLVSNGGNDIYLIKLDSLGKVVKGLSFGGLQNDEGMELDIDSAQNIFICGDISSLVDFGNNKICNSNGSKDFLVMKISQPGQVDTTSTTKTAFPQNQNIDISIFPVPVKLSNEVLVVSNEFISNIEAFDLNGKKIIFLNKYSQTGNKFNLSFSKPGNYMLKIIFYNGITLSKMILVE